MHDCCDVSGTDLILLHSDVSDYFLNLAHGRSATADARTHVHAATALLPREKCGSNEARETKPQESGGSLSFTAALLCVGRAIRDKVAARVVLRRVSRCKFTRI